MASKLLSACVVGLVLLAIGVAGGTCLAGTRPAHVDVLEQDGRSALKLRLQASDAYSLTQQDGHVVLRVMGETLAAPAAGGAHNMARLQTSGSFLRFDIGKFERVVVSHAGSVLMLKVVSDPVAPPAASGATGMLPGLPAPLVAIVEGARPTGRPSLQSPADTKPPERATQMAAPEQPVPGGAGASHATMVDGATLGLGAGRGLLLPFEKEVGAAVFGRGSATVIVFDVARALDLTEVSRDPLAAGADTRLLPEATMLTLPDRQASQVLLQRVPAGWLLQNAQADRKPIPIEPVLDGKILRLPVPGPGRVVNLPDPRTGENLLVGTVRSGAESFDHDRRGHAYAIEATTLGIVIAPLSDRIEMRPTRSAFLVTGLDPLALALPEGGEDAQRPPGGAGGRILELRRGERDTLYRRSKQAVAVAAAAPAGSRFRQRLMAAEAALSLGDATQALTLTQVAVADDARQACSRLTRIVRLAATVLDRQPEEDDCPADPGYTDSPEVAFWRGISLAGADPTRADAARLLAGNIALLESYPQPLLADLLPIVAGSLVEGGTDPEAALVGKFPPGARIAYARALLAVRQGHHREALAALETLKSDVDMRIAYLASEKIVALRLGDGSMTPAKAAGILDNQLLDARIAGHELPARFRLADLRIEAAEWPEALALLRETAQLFPEQQDDIRRRAGGVLKRLATAPAGPGSADALRDVMMIEANMDLVPKGPDGERLTRYLVERLAALDLPAQAAPLVRTMMGAAKPGLEKAALGIKLASLDLQRGDLHGLRQALQDSDEGNLPLAVVEQRRMLLARGLAADDHNYEALAAIKDLTSVPALDLKAELLMKQGQWRDASDTLARLVDLSVPVHGAFSDAQQDLLLRLASAASRAKDVPRQAQVRIAVAGRLTNPDTVALFQLLTSTDAPSSAGDEVAALRRATAAVKSLGK